MQKSKSRDSQLFCTILRRGGGSCLHVLIFSCSHVVRGWRLCEIIDQAGAGFHKPGQQQRLLFPVEAGQDDYIKEI